MEHHIKSLTLGACVATESRSSLGWQHYEDPKANVELLYPTAIFKAERSKASPAGMVFTTQDGSARLLIGALPNTEKHTPRSYQKFISDERLRSDASLRSASVVAARDVVETPLD